MNPHRLETIAAQLVHSHKGILAADESNSSIKDRFDQIGLKSTVASRRDYRQLLIEAPEIDKYISGVILYEETLKQKTRSGLPIPELLYRRKILTGIKVDLKTFPLALHPGEVVTHGLDDLRERLGSYKRRGASFTKWRAVIKIDKNLPSQACLLSNAHALARYAALAQEANLVPIVEPEVLITGNHNLKTAAQVTTRTLTLVFDQLRLMGVHLPGILLKPNMVTPGDTARKQATVEEVAIATLKVFRKAIPEEVPGIVFLSGGQSPDLACAHLNQMNLMGNTPWQLSFSFGRALQQETLHEWRGDEKRWLSAQVVFANRARLCSKARRGKLVE